MSSVNQVTLLGRLGKDPELRYLPDGKAVCNITVATSQKWKDKATGEAREETEWTRVNMFERTAEIAGEYLKKGHLVYIQGRMKTRKWTDKENIERYVTEVVCERMQLMPNPQTSGGQGSGQGGDDGGYETRQQERPRSNAPASGGYERQGTGRPAVPSDQRPAQRDRGPSGFDDLDQDIPF